MTRYWVYFRGTTNGQYVQADTAKQARAMFAYTQMVPLSTYIAYKRA